MDTDDKPPESGDEIEPVSLREIEMILKPGKPPPPIKKPDAPSPPRPPRAPLKTTTRTQADMGVGDLAAFAVLSGSTPPPPAVAAPAPPRPPGRPPMASSTDEAGKPRPPRPLPKPPAKRESLVDERERAATSPKREEKAPDSALEDLRALARESQRPKSASVDFDDLLSLRDDASARALSSPAIPMDLTLLTSSPAATPDESWDDPAPPAKAASIAESSVAKDDAEPPPSAPPSSTRGPSSRRAIGGEGGRDGARAGKSSRPPKSQRGARTASKAPTGKRLADDRGEPAPIVPVTARTASVAPVRDSTSFAPQSMPPAFAKRRSMLPILLGVGAVALVAIIWLATRGTDQSAPEAKNSSASPDSTSPDSRTPPTKPAQPDPRPTSTDAPVPATTDVVATRSGNPDPVSPSPNTTGTRPVDPLGTTPTTPATSTATTTTAPSTPPTTAPTTTAATEPGGEFNAGAASSALAGRAGAAAGCKQPGDPSGVATVTVTFAPSGRVTQANVSGPPFAGTKTGGCIAGAMKGASVPPFSGPAKTVSKTVQIP